MITVVAVWEGRISPVFDVSQEAVVLRIENGTVMGREVQSIGTAAPHQKIQRLKSLQVDTLICGAISEGLAHELDASGMTVIGFVAGELEMVVKNYLAGVLPSPQFAMPGCRKIPSSLQSGIHAGGSPQDDHRAYRGRVQVSTSSKE